MSDGDLVSIGAFAMISGLTISALRHYDDVGLLRPAFVDPATGYRRYQPGQVRRARVIFALRQVGLPIDAIREGLDGPDDEGSGAMREVLIRHRGELLFRAHALSEKTAVLDRYIEYGVAMPDLKTPRLTQITINVRDLAEAVTFYQGAFETTFNEEVSSFQFGTWPADDFFLLTVAHGASSHGEHHGPARGSRFGLMVGDLDAAHQRALDAGASEVSAPYTVDWKPRTSCVADPSGNRIDLYQA